jgi:hypothetical protein
VTVYIFLGPTLSIDEARAELDAYYLPPASQGDVYRASLHRPLAIGIIDGYFERMPAVWHKEILWAMHQGIHVYGSASIGALRAAELYQFGMVGVGEIFRAYQNGTLEDDDEVAVAHHSPEFGYTASSEAMINIRYTLAAAEVAGIISPRTRATLEQIAKRLFYPERSYSRIIERASEQNLPIHELSLFQSWLPTGKVNQKRADALNLLQIMRELLAGISERKHVQYSFEYTEMWDQVIHRSGELHLETDAPSETMHLDTLLDELRIEGTSYAEMYQGTMLRFLASWEARRQGMLVNPKTLQEIVESFRREKDLLDSKSLDRWLEEQDLSREKFIQLMEEEVQVRWLYTVSEIEVLRQLPNYLRINGKFRRFMERARDKKSKLVSYGFDNPSLSDVNLTQDELIKWYFEKFLGIKGLQNLSHFIESNGFQDENAFRRAILREYCYRSVLEGTLTA